MFLSITRSLAVKPYICYGEILPHETRNIPLSYGAKHIWIGLSWTV